MTGGARIRLAAAILAIAAAVDGGAAARQKPKVPEPQRGAIAGIVRDAESGGGVPDAVVHLQRQGGGDVQERRTDGQGGFYFNDLRAGGYLLSAEKGERKSGDQVVSLSDRGERREIDLTLPPGAHKDEAPPDESQEGGLRDRKQRLP